jgi:hypothetical protein
VVLGDDEALMVGGGGDLDEDAAGGSVAVGRGDEVIVKGWAIWMVEDSLVASMPVLTEGETRTWTPVGWAVTVQAATAKRTDRPKRRMDVSGLAERFCEGSVSGKLMQCRVLRDVIPPIPPGPEGSNGNGSLRAQ